MAPPDPIQPQIDPQLLRDYRRGRLPADAERAFEERLLAEAGLAEELHWDEQLEDVARTWSTERGETVRGSRGRFNPMRPIAWAAAASFAAGVILTGAGAVLAFRDAAMTVGGSARIVSFDVLRAANQSPPTRTFHVDPSLDFVVIEVPTRTPDGETVAVTLRQGDGEPRTFAARVHEGFASVVVPIATVSQGRYSVRTTHAGDPTFELIVSSE